MKTVRSQYCRTVLFVLGQNDGFHRGKTLGKVGQNFGNNFAVNSAGADDAGNTNKLIAADQETTPESPAQNVFLTSCRRRQAGSESHERFGLACR